MSGLSDRELILEYGRTGTNAAFEELVHRHVDLVYSTAFRILCDASLAEDVTQRVFVALTRNARRLQHRTVLAGWLQSTLGLIMASTKVKIGLTVLLAAGLTAPLVIQHQAGERWRRELAVLRQRNAELERRLLEHPSPPSTLDVQGVQGRPQERDELLRLRAEVGSLRSQLSNLASARSGTPGAQAPMTGGSEELRVPAASWANVGLATPRTALQTLSWAKANRDAGTLVSALAWADEQTRAALEALFAAAPETVRAQHGSVEGFLLSVVAEPWVRSGSNRIVSYRVVSEATEAETSALEVEWGFEGGHTKTEPFRLVRVGEDWREPFDASGRALHRFADMLQVEGRAPAAPPEEP